MDPIKKLQEELAPALESAMSAEFEGGIEATAKALVRALAATAELAERFDDEVGPRLCSGFVHPFEVPERVVDALNDDERLVYVAALVHQLGRSLVGWGSFAPWAIHGHDPASPLGFAKITALEAVGGTPPEVRRRAGPRGAGRASAGSAA